MSDNKKLKSVRLGRAEDLSEEVRKKHNLPDEGMIAMETWEVKTLAERVLKKVAKEFKIEKDEAKRTWKEVPKNYCFSKERVERIVDLALQLSQEPSREADTKAIALEQSLMLAKARKQVIIEVLGIINEHKNREIKIPTYWSRAINQTAFIAGVDYEFEEFKDDLKKRLLAKPEVKL